MTKTRYGQPKQNYASSIQAFERQQAAIALMPGEPEPRGDVDDGCRWLNGPPERRNFCGAALKTGHSWCEHHHKRVFV